MNHEFYIIIWALVARTPLNAQINRYSSNFVRPKRNAIFDKTGNFFFINSKNLLRKNPRLFAFNEKILFNIVFRRVYGSNIFLIPIFIFYINTYIYIWYKAIWASVEQTAFMIMKIIYAGIKDPIIHTVHIRNLFTRSTHHSVAG